MGDQTTVTVGVDTHADVHVAAVLAHTGKLLDTRSFPTTTRGYAQLATWADSFGHVDKVGLEGTGSYGSGLLRFLTDYGFTVIEVDRPDRSTRRRAGKSDVIDAEAAARVVLSGRATGTPKSRDAQVEMIRALRVARRGAMKARIQAGGQLDALIVSAPQAIRQSLRGLTGKHHIRGCAALRHGPITDPAAATKLALRSLARRWLALQAEIDDLDIHLTTLVTAAAPDLVALPGVGVDTAGQLLVTAGDNPDRLRSEAAFARLCGAAPIPVSSGRTDRHRLHRGGDRDANSALWRVALVRMRCHQPTRDYVARRTAEGKTKTEIMRCLKRYIAARLLPASLRHPPSTANRHACQDRAVLRSVEVTAVLALSDSPFHNLHWKSDVELSLDCFICQRTGRTTGLKHGAEHGTCSGDSKTGQHPMAARISAFDHTSERGRTILRAVVDYWWAPFHDAKRDQPSLALTRAPWVRLHLGYLCPEPVQSGTFSTQTNLVRPQTHTCEHCAEPVAHSHDAPRIQFLT